MLEPELVYIRTMFLTLLMLQTSNLHYYSCVTNIYVKTVMHHEVF